jgi:Uma2 family endonuclease
LKGKKCEVFPDGVEVHLTEDDMVFPDVVVVCDKDIIKDDGIHGAPSLVVEVLSPSTARNDIGYKKNLYEKCGVAEYWVVDPKSCRIEVSILRDGKYVTEGVYSKYPEYLLKKLRAEEWKDVINEFSPSLFPDLKIDILDIFEGIEP